MAQQTLDNGDSGTTFRGKTNDNFTELYARSNWNTSGGTTVTTPTITGDVTFVGTTTLTGRVVGSRTETAVDDARPVIIPLTYLVQPASAPAMAIDYHGIDISMNSSGNTNSDTRLYPFEVTTGHTGTGTLGRAVNIYTNSRNTSTGTISDITQIRQRVTNSGGGTIANIYCRQVDAPVNSSGTITNFYGDYINDVTQATNNWGYYSLTNNNYLKGLSLGDSPSALGTSVLLNMLSTTKAPVLPRMTTAERDALTAVAGMLIYNTTTGKLNVRGASAWEAVTSA